MSNLTADQRAFDSWFRSQPSVKQAMLRREGVIPYREMPAERYVFEVKPESGAWAHDPWDEELRTEEDTFISRERVREIIGRVLDSLSRSPDRNVRLHLELVRMAIRTPDALSNGEICASYSLTRQAVHYRVMEMRRVLFGKKRKAVPTHPIKESPHDGTTQRGVDHRVEKTRTHPRKQRYLAKSRANGTAHHKNRGNKA